MKKIIGIVLIFSFLISCGSSSSVSKINRYIKNVDKRKDFSESITEYIIEESAEHDITGGSEISILTDNNGILRRIIADENESNRIPANYQFYYQDNTLVFFRIVEFNKARTDTITDSVFYFKNEKLITRIDRKKDDTHSDYIKEISEYYKRGGT